METWSQKQAAFLKANVKAGYRKSYDQFKPILVTTIPGRTDKLTEVIGRSEFKRSRGILFNSKEEAVEYAQGILERRIQDCLK